MARSSSGVAAVAASAASIASASSRRAAATGASSAASSRARNSPSRARATVSPAAIAWPPPLVARPEATSPCTMRPMSTPGIERAEAEAILQPRGDEADDARRPALAGDDDAGAALLQSERDERLRLRLGQRRRLDALALAIEPVEFGGDSGRLGGVSGAQQPRAQRRIADAAAGVDAGADEEAQMIGRRRPAGAGD